MPNGNFIRFLACLSPSGALATVDVSLFLISRFDEIPTHCFLLILPRKIMGFEYRWLRPRRRLRVLI